MSTEYYLSMGDDEFQQLIASNSGEMINDPFYDSVLFANESWEFTDRDDDTGRYQVRDLTQIPAEEKQYDLDVEDDSETE